ncbi:unnamed protein product [Penicillium egyptiacum]|uniref:F-box domain-containing protein n=1 Tax=Penicillium egyptiacum TaxID=1303716 RepID=A0A9W4P6Q0_9EURO|nr:unnamed protein product [Penicillium egyptiacum]
MPFKKLRKKLKILFSFRVRPATHAKFHEPTASQIAPQRGNDNLLQVAETEGALKTSQVPLSLENLPAELRRHILSMVDVDSLKTLVQASPIYFHQYRLDRKLLLCQSLESTLGSVTADAYAVHKFSSIKVATRRNPEGVQNPFTSYHMIRSQVWSAPLYKVLSMEEVTSMVKFHCSIVQPLMRCFVTRASSDLTKKTKGSQIEETSSRTEETRLMREIEEILSRTEDTRLMCAFYRFQLCCNIYGLESRDSVSLNRRIATPGRILKYFLCTFDPWLVKHVSCLSYFTEEKFQQIVHKITRDLGERSPGFDGNIRSDDRLLKTPICHGLELLHFVYSKIKDTEDNDQLITVTKYSMIWRFSGFLEDTHSVFDVCLRWHTLRLALGIAPGTPLNHYALPR